MSIENRTGSPAEKENFFGRTKELGLAWEKINDGNSLILAAPRRVGKTSFAKRMIDDAETRGWNVLFLNLECIQDEAAFVKHFAKELAEQSWFTKVCSSMTSLLEGFKPKAVLAGGGVELSVEWNKQRTDVFDELKSLIRPEADTLIVMDELAIFLSYLLKNNPNGVKDVEFFLNWLRSFRQIKGSRVRWIFCSSIGIENFISIHGLSNTMNDVDSFDIGELRGVEPRELVKALGRSKKIEFSEECIDYFLEKLGWPLPFYIQILFSELYRQKEIEEKPVSKELIDKAYDRLLSAKYFNTWDERLNEYDQLQRFMRLLLNRLSQNKAGEAREQLSHLLRSSINDEMDRNRILSDVLRVLINDGYLMKGSDGRYGFRSPLLRDFWYNRFII